MNLEYEKRIRIANEAANDFFESIKKSGNMEMLQNHKQIDELYLQVLDITGVATEEERKFYFQYSNFHEYMVIFMIVNGVLEKQLNGRKILNAVELKTIQDQATWVMDSVIEDNDRYKSFYLEKKEEIIAELNEVLKEQGFTVKTGGCYIATAVYGSYDCPQVWTLRRYRDEKMAKYFLGRMFIRVYYSISPVLVKWFGNKKWFIYLWRGLLDGMVDKLLNAGYEDTPYMDL